jgi:hypothetical protein
MLTEKESDVQREYVQFAYRGVVEKLCRLSHVIERAQFDAPHPNLSVFSKLQAKVDREIRELEEQQILLLLDEQATVADYRTACSNLQSFFRRIPGLHKDVVYWVSGPWAPRQVVMVILKAVEEAFGSDVASLLRKSGPIVAQTGMYDFLADDFEDDRKHLEGDASTAVWAIPYAEVQNPLSWVMLFHEVAHTLVRRSHALQEALEQFRTKIPNQHVSNLLKYLSELLADRIAADVAGPAYYAALTTFILLERHSEFRPSTDRRHTQVYPPARQRIVFVEQHLAESMSLPLSERGELDMELARCIQRLFQGRCELDETISRVELQPDLSWLEECPSWRDVLEYAYAMIIRKYYKGPPFSRIQRQSVMLSKGLLSGVPVGASPRPGSRPAAVHMLSRGSLAFLEKENIDFRRILMEELCEQPNSPRAVLNAGWIAEEKEWREDRQRLLLTEVRSIRHVVDAVKETLRTRDDLLTKSLDSLLLHSELLDIFHSEKHELT